MSETDTQPIPEIRQDLALYRAGMDQDGTPLWHLHDPLANKFYRLEERDVELLALIGHRSAERITELANSLFPTQTTEEEVTELVEFLRLNNLVVADPTQHDYFELQLAAAQKRDWLRLLFRTPLFFRIPIWNPDRFLGRTLPYVKWLGSKPATLCFVVMALVGIYLVSRQIDVFLNTFLHFFSWSGAAVYLITLFGVKILHELGHAYAAKAAGCRVPTIGVAFMVGWPILYTDTSDAWKIPDRRTRLRIGIAGVGVEMVVAVVSLFLWSIAPEGSLKSAFFLLASTTWLLSILVNFNPLMRFDGYYLLSDLWGKPNLEKRSFEMAKWWIREHLFGFGILPPEQYRRGLVVFAFSVWAYRLLLFFGIALLVFSYLFPAAGMTLFVVQVFLLIIRPVQNEIKVWWGLRDQMRFNRISLRSLSLLAALAGFVFIPWMTNVSAPALLQGLHSDLYLPESGAITRMPQTGASYQESTPLIELVSPNLDHEIQLVQYRYRELSRAQASIGFDSELRSQAMVIQSELRTQNQRYRGLLEKKAQLSLQPAFTGSVVDIAPDVRIGDWLPVGFRVATVVDESVPSVTAYMREEDIGRIRAGSKGKFFPENLEHGVREVVVKEIDYVGGAELDKLYLASLFGGDIGVRENDDGSLTMIQSHYRLELEPLDREEVRQVVRGVVVLDGDPLSLFAQVKRRFVAVFIRETGF